MMMFSGVTTLILCSVIQDVGSAETNNMYILPALGLGGESEDSGVQITLLISNMNMYDISPSARLKHNNTDVASDEGTVQDLDVSSFRLSGFEESALLNRSELANKSIEISDSYSFDLHVIYEKNGYAEGYAAISTADVGNEYYVSTFCALGGYCQIAVAPVEVGPTRVYIRLPEEVDEVVICVGQKYWRSKYHTTVNLTYPESLQIETTHDLTGTFIYSDGPISVIAGTRSMPGQNGALLHFMEQLAPVTHWGTEFVVRGFETAYGCVIHITSSVRKTVVEMTGYKTVEMSGNGQTLKRRLEETTVCYIKSNKPVQVMMYVGLTYGSYDVIESVGMTTVPAVEHFQFQFLYLINCDTSPKTFFQYVLENDDYVPSHSDSISTKVPFTKYQVRTVSVTSVTSTKPNTLMTDKVLPFGGIFQCNTAVFPMIPTLITTSGCTEDVARMSTGDGVDNDCDGDIDEDYCFENAKITYTFVPGSSETIPVYTANVTGFYELLFRVQSCGSTQLELKDNGTGKIVVHISRSQILLYQCFPECDTVERINTTDMLLNVNCASDVISYWVMQSSGSFCINIGRRNFDGVCPGKGAEVSLTSDLVEMRLSGLMNNATIWYDMYKTDCGKFNSDWRCHDAVGNCFEYKDNMCSKANFSQWVDQNCRKFCGLCTPDSYGRMFVYYPVPWGSLAQGQHLKIAGSNSSSSRIGIQTTNWFETTIPVFVEERPPANISISGALVTNTYDPVFIVTEDDAIVYFGLELNSVKSRLLQPLDALGTEYMIISFGSSPLLCNGVAVEPGTTTDIFTSSSTTSYVDYSSFSEYLSDNQTGTLMTGNKPFAVFCGMDESSEYGASWFQLPATKTWGTHYITPSLGTNFNQNILAKIKVVANSNNTVIEVHGDFDGIYLLLARGDSKELPVDPSVSYNITSNFPVGVAILFYGTTKKNSSVHIIPAAENFMDSPVLMGYTDFIDNVTSLTETPLVGNVTEYTFNDTDLPYGDFFFKSENSYSFLAFLREFPDGIDVTPSASLFKDFTFDQICRLGDGTVGDGSDTDCDGLADEERVCYSGYGTTKQDSDLDGAFDEDCETIEEGSGSMEVPEEPQCAPAPEYTNSSCWQNCRCRCSWAASLEHYQTMNKSEQDAYNQVEIDKYQKDMEVDEESLSSSVATKQSADDERTSSKSIGVAGCIFIFIVLGFVVIFDTINVIQKIRQRCSQSAVEDFK